VKKKQTAKQRKKQPRDEAPRSSPSPGGLYEIAGRWPIVALAVISLLLSLPLFEPISWWPFGFVVLVPLVLAICAGRSGRTVYWTAYLFGVVFFLIHFRWLYTTTPEGYVAASFYLASYILLAAWLVRHFHRRRGLPVVLVLPVVWTAVELLRSRGPLGFPWFLLGHSQIRLLSMIQIADLAGVFGVTFVLAAFTGWVVDLTLWRVPRLLGRPAPPMPRWMKPATAAVAALLIFTVGYGRYRLGQETLSDGPTIAVVQGDFPLMAVRGVNGADDMTKAATYLRMAREAGRSSPDLIVLPETPWTLRLDPEARELYPACRLYHEEFRRMSDRYDAMMVVGAMSVDPQPPGTYPASHRYNSAFVYTPDVEEPVRYDKIHRVPFGEFVPFRYTKGLFWFYRFLNDSYFNPWGRGGVEYSLTAGDDFTMFAVPPKKEGDQPLHFGVTICYEDVIPQVFHRSFRAVENRVPVARAVNTGVSGFVTSVGRWHDLVSDPDRRPEAGGTGYRIARIRVDSRVSFYSRHGDVFAGLCGLCSLAGLVDIVVKRIRRRRKIRANLRRKTPDKR